MNFGLYIHIPFCRQKCLYCDFPSKANLEHIYDRYCAALCREIAVQGSHFADWQVDTVYIGGGTPTVLALEQLRPIVAAIKANFHLKPEAEISIEANPGTVDVEKLAGLLELGINRISFGVQAFSDRLLRLLGRLHSAAEGIEAVRSASKAGFENISIDLMYGLPQQTLADLSDSLSTAVSLPLTHISVYGLQVEEGTPFAKALADGTLCLPDEDTEEQMYDLVTTYLPAHGWERYEISNYARPGHACRHNLGYWLYQPYLGLGAAAHSFYDGRRRANTADILQYITCIETGRSPQQYDEELPLATAMAEYVFLQLRTAQGLDVRAFSTTFAEDFTARYGDVVARLVRQQLLRPTERGWALTERGMKFGNIAFAAFLP